MFRQPPLINAEWQQSFHDVNDFDSSIVKWDRIAILIEIAYDLPTHTHTHKQCVHTSIYHATSDGNAQCAQVARDILSIH